LSIPREEDRSRLIGTASDCPAAIQVYISPAELSSLVETK